MAWRTSILCAPLILIVLLLPALARDDATLEPQAVDPLTAARNSLGTEGIGVTLSYVGEILGNGSGGLKRGATYEGRIDAAGDIDMGTLAGIAGVTVHARAFEINGRGLSGNNTLDLFTVSSIEAYPSVKLYDLWAEQKLAGGLAAIRLGQLAASSEFFANPTAAPFVSSAFGWPPSFGNDLASGGPAYPLATPGARLKMTPRDNITFLAGIFDDNPAGPYRPGVNSILPQVRDRNGTAFRLQDPPLVMTEAALTYNQSQDSTLPPGTLKAGYFYDFGSFAALNTPASVNFRGNHGIYGMITQSLARMTGAGGAGSAVFARVSCTPGDRNLIDLYFDSGITIQGLIPSRQYDIAGLAMAYGRLSPALARLDASEARMVPDYQAEIEATYQIAVTPGLSVQPDFQYVIHPSANTVSNPATGLGLRNAAIFGLRAIARY